MFLESLGTISFDPYWGGFGDGNGGIFGLVGSDLAQTKCSGIPASTARCSAVHGHGEAVASVGRIKLNHQPWSLTAIDGSDVILVPSEYQKVFWPM